MKSSRFTIASNEALIWESSPSQLRNFKSFFLFGLGFLASLAITPLIAIVGIIGMLTFAFLIFDKYVETRDSRFDLTHERIKIVSGGILSGRQTYEIHREDLVDVKLNETYIQQIFKIGTLVLEFKGDPLLTSYRDLVEKKKHFLVGIRDPHRAYEIVRAGIKNTRNSATLTLEQYDLKLSNKSTNESESTESTLLE